MGLIALKDGSDSMDPRECAIKMKTKGHYL